MGPYLRRLALAALLAGFAHAAGCTAASGTPTSFGVDLNAPPFGRLRIGVIQEGANEKPLKTATLAPVALPPS